MKPNATLPVVLSEEEVERLMQQPGLRMLKGLRDRAVLEFFYSTGVRRGELCALKLPDVSVSRKTVMIRHGKGDKDRLLPFGPRALYWLERYLLTVRPELLLDIKEQTVFLNDYGELFRDSKLGDKVKRCMKHAGIEAPGSCHLLRHACATHRLEKGAELRFIQAIIGHADPRATQLYTHVSCPFHDDHEPSLVVTPEKNLWRCQGAFQAGGTVIDWVMRAEGVSFRHAVELLQHDYRP